MNKRRSLIVGLSTKSVDRDVESRFVTGDAEKPAEKKPQPPPADQTPALAENTLVPISTRLRPDISMALRRASLERKLNRQDTNTVQEILESALAPWLRDHGYLS